MKPFKFFFGIAIATMVLLFVLKFIIPAVLIAGVLTIIYQVFKRISYFIDERRWGDYNHNGRFGYNEMYSAPLSEDKTFKEGPWKEPVWMRDPRTIIIQ